MKGIEALHDAFMHQEGWYPGSVANRNRNPGNLLASGVPHTKDARGYCVFESIVDGSEALLRDLTDKISGNNSHKLTPNSMLIDLCNVYAPSPTSAADTLDKGNVPTSYAINVAQWLTLALGRSITPSTKLGDICPEQVPVSKDLA